MSSDTSESGSEFEPRDLARLPDFYHPAVSPSGDCVAYYYDETGRNELYVRPTAGGDPRQVSDGDVPRNARWHVGWFDDETLLFHRDDDGDEQNDIVTLDVETGETDTLVAPDGQAILYDVSTDGRHVLYGSDERDQLNVYRYDAETGDAERLTAYEQPVWGARFSPDGDHVAYVANESDDLANRDTYVMAADGTKKRKLDVGIDGAECAPSDWFTDGERLLVTDNADDCSRVGVYDLATDDVAWLTDGTHEEHGVAVAADGRVVTARTREAAVVPVVYGAEAAETDGRSAGRELDFSEGVASFGNGGDRDTLFTADGELLVAHTTASARKTLYTYDLDTDATRTLVAPKYGDIDPEAFVDPEYVTSEPGDVPEWCDDGDTLEIGALLFDARKRPGADLDADGQPAVVMVHGGPHSQSQKAFSPYVQFLVAKGYTVLQPNYRGSTGRGRRFKQAIHGDWGGMEQADIAAGADRLAEYEWIDGDRLAVFGGSYGGYSAYSQLVRYPERWATGVAWIGITDLLAMYDESMPHFQAMLEQQLGDPEENETLWHDRSPITHVENLSAPVFIIHGVNDVRCPISQARLFRDALEARGWREGRDGEFEYEELGEEGHGSTDQRQKLRAFELLGDYLDRRL